MQNYGRPLHEATNLIFDGITEKTKESDIKTNAKKFKVHIGKRWALFFFVLAVAACILALLMYIADIGTSEEKNYAWALILPLGIVSLFCCLFLLLWKCRISEEKIVESSIFFKKTVYWKDVKEVKYQTVTKVGERGEKIFLFGNRKWPLITFEEGMIGYKNVKSMIRRKRIPARIS